jgi:hypothetical protein
VTIKLLWLPGPTDYRLRVFAGANTELRRFAGELVLTAGEAWALHEVLVAGAGVLGDGILSETGWLDVDASQGSRRV